MLGQIGSSLESESLNALRDFSSKIGLAFQITDDILDVTQIESILGKNKNSDAKNNKLTYIDIIGLGEAKLKANKLTDLALNSLNQSNITNIDKLIEMAKYLIGRES
jgi:geranylgeranyl pyrophosphate synthase